MKPSYYIIASLAFIISFASGRQVEDDPLPRNCLDIRGKGFSQVGHYVVYQTTNNHTEHEDAIMIYCDEKDGMKLPKEEDEAPPRSAATHCKDILDQGVTQDGYYIIYPFSEHPETAVLVHCDQSTAGGGWTLINRRDEEYDNPIDFQRTFDEYAEGFGNVNYDFYIGNEVIHSLTDSSINELWVTIGTKDGETGYEHYQYFHVGARVFPEYGTPPYMLDSGFYEGTLGDGMEVYNGMGFTTLDQDNDIFDDDNCARKYGGGWWYKMCVMTNLNGLYGNSHFRWYSTEHDYPYLRKAQMMVRPLI
ncbi:unnamed protein product [Meganyctiphanes norvegica]|uniref:Fibrinogen C-terminal domain-containing protein n=1 Tax=Meganyctiphanes norvegica TaxID=48144 RepID=A0AAV2RPF5_MEGNR